MRGDNIRRLFALSCLSALIFGTSVVIGYGTISPSSGGGGTAATFTLDAITLLQTNTVVFVLLLTGGVTFGLTGFFFLFTTGAALGGAVRLAVIEGFDPVTIAMLIAPHAWLELPAFFLAAAVGFDLAWRIVAYLRGTRPIPISRDTAWEHATAVVIGYACLALAALIEATVTREIARSVA